MEVRSASPSKIDQKMLMKSFVLITNINANKEEVFSFFYLSGKVHRANKGIENILCIYLKYI